MDVVGRMGAGDGLSFPGCPSSRDVLGDVVAAGVAAAVVAAQLGNLVVEVDGAEECKLREDDVDASMGVTP